MPQQKPQFIPGLVFNEPFFDQVIKVAGGCRLLEIHKPPPHTRHVDYLINGFAVELKILTRDVLEAPERQEKLRRLISKELPRGPMYVTATKREVRMAGSFADAYWEQILGAPIQDRLDKAADQIADTRTFVPGPLLGAVIIVNAAGPSLDWKSFSNLANHYAERFDAIDAIFALSAVPVPLENGIQFHFARIGRTGHTVEVDALGILLGNTINSEMCRLLGKQCQTEEVDAHGPSEKIVFQYTPAGLRRKMP
jgi:hypothetical protein